MALIKCSECGREVSDKAAACPACGNPISTASLAVVESSPSGSQKSYTATEWAISWGLTALILILAFVLNPSEEQHRAKIREAVEQQHPISKYFGLSQLAALDVRYQSFGFMSLTTRGGRNITLGMYGYVHLFNP